MKRLIIAAHARTDLFEIWEFLAQRDGPAAADLMTARIYDALARLRTTSQIGRPRPELAPRLRSWNVPPYLLLYQADRTSLSLVRVVHGSRDLNRLMLTSDADTDDPDNLFE